MSQRLLISKKENVIKDDEIYDCIYTEDSDYKKLLYDWCCYNEKTGVYLGPWKIRIRDLELVNKFLGDFKKLGKFIPKLQSLNDVWAIYKD